MQRFYPGLVLLVLAAGVRAEETPEQPTLTLQSGGHTAPISQVLFMPDGKELLTVSQDRTVRRWDVATGERLGVFYLPTGQGDQGALYGAALSPDGKILAVAGVGYRDAAKGKLPIHLIDLAEGRVAAVLHRPAGTVHSLAFAHDGQRLAVGIYGQAFLLDVATDKVLHTLEAEGMTKSWVNEVAFSPDDKLLALRGSGEGQALLWSVASGEQVCRLVRPKTPVSAIAWKDNHTLATGLGEYGGVAFWDTHGKLLRHFDKLPGHPGNVASITFLHAADGSKEPKELFFAFHTEEGQPWDYRRSGGGVLNLANPEKSREGYAARHLTVNTTGAVSPDGRLAATTDGPGVNLWSLQDGKLVRRLVGRGQDPTGAGWGPEGRVVAWTYGKKETLKHAFDLDDLSFENKLDTKFVRAAHTLQSAANGEMHADLGDYQVKVIGGKDKTNSLATIKTDHNVGAHCYTFLPGDRLALGLWEHVLVYDAPSGKRLHRLEGPTGTIRDLAPSPDGRYLLGAFSDQTLRIWKPEKSEPLLSLFVAGHDWVVWTQEGYYAATPGGERLMGWTVNHGLDQLATFYPAERFRKVLYRPDVIKLVLAKGSVKEALKAADAALGQKTVPTEVEELLPPQAVLDILDRTGLAQGKVKLKATATAAVKSEPVTALRLLVDGRPLPDTKTVLDLGAGQAKAEAEWDVDLPPGDHELKVLARSPDVAGVSSALPISVPVAAGERPTLHLLAVGIDAYQQKGLHLNCASNDAKELAQAFQEHCAGQDNLFGKVQSSTLLDAQATRAAVLDALKEERKTVKPGDLLVFSFAGHGVQQGREFYLLTVEADTTNLAQTALSGKELRQALADMPCQVLLLLDACHSAAGVRAFLPATDEAARDLSDDDCAIAVLCAAMGPEKALEEGSHGYFTQALVEALAKQQDVPYNYRDGRQYVHHLFAYVFDEVKDLSKDQQHPFLNLPFVTESFPIRQLPRK